MIWNSTRSKERRLSCAPTLDPRARFTILRRSVLVQSCTSIAGKDMSEASSPGRNLRVAEKLVFAFLALVLLASFFFPLRLEDRLKVWGLNLATAFILFLLSG